jgi:8-amino-7-oxononanoate synthase
VTKTTGDSTRASGVTLGPRTQVRASTARTVTLGERELLFFGGCGYLALAHEPRVRESLREASFRHGTSSGASRETTGNVEEHELLEAELARFLGLEAALLLPEGALANLALGEALGTRIPHALLDPEAHPTLVRAAGLGGASAAAWDPRKDLASQVSNLDGEVCLWTDGVFPMQGRRADAAALLGALPRGRGLLVIDDCHGFGVLGARGRGSLEAAGVSDERAILTGTFSKALGTYGGFVAGTAERVGRVRARSGLYTGTTPLPPPLAAAARTALCILAEEPQRLERYRRSTAAFRRRMSDLGVALRPLEFPVVAFELESADRMARVHARALDQGVFVPYIRYAGAGEHGSFRIVWNAAHTEDDLERLAGALARALETA